MALSANMAWEVRPTNGSDTNGGGFVAGSGGTDYSQQNSPQLTVSDAACTGNTTVTSTTGGFTAAMVGSVMYLSSGPGWYQITARASSNSITIDRNGPNASGMTANVGGALKTLATVIPIYIASNKIFVKAEAAITITSGQTFATGATQTANQPYTRLIGYTTTRTDRGQVTITASTATGTKWLRTTAAGFSFENFIVNCSSLGTSTGIAIDGNTSRVTNCKVQNATTAGISSSVGNSLIYGNEVTGCTSAATAAINDTATNEQIMFNNVHDNACIGIMGIGGMSSVQFNLVTNNIGASSDGINFPSQTICMFNTVYGSGRHGINVTASTRSADQPIKNNILEANGGFGLAFTATAGNPADLLYDGNAYYNNTSGTRSNADDTGTTNPINGVSPYTNSLDIINTTGSFFTNAAGGDFTLNNAANRGTLIRGHGVPATFPGATGTGYPDMGVFQHQDPSAVIIVEDD